MRLLSSSMKLLSNCLSIYDVVVIEKKFQWRTKVHPLWVGQLLLSHSFCKFTLLGLEVFWVDHALSQSLNTYDKIHNQGIVKKKVTFLSLYTYFLLTVLKLELFGTANQKVHHGWEFFFAIDGVRDKHTCHVIYLSACQKEKSTFFPLWKQWHINLKASDWNILHNSKRRRKDLKIILWRLLYYSLT